MDKQTQQAHDQIMQATHPVKPRTGPGSLPNQRRNRQKRKLLPVTKEDQEQANDWSDINDRTAETVYQSLIGLSQATSFREVREMLRTASSLRHARKWTESYCYNVVKLVNASLLALGTPRTARDVAELGLALKSLRELANDPGTGEVVALFDWDKLTQSPGKTKVKA